MNTSQDIIPRILQGDTHIIESLYRESREPCRSLLFAFYVQNKSMEELAEEMNYKNADTVKNVKYKCLQRLRKLCDGLKGSNEEI